MTEAMADVLLVVLAVLAVAFLGAAMALLRWLVRERRGERVARGIERVERRCRR